MILIAEWDLDLARTAARIPEQSAQILRGRIMGSGMWQHGLSVSACAFSIPRGSRFLRPGRCSEQALPGLDRPTRRFWDGYKEMGRVDVLSVVA
jgi:hypothetical protein